MDALTPPRHAALERRPEDFSGTPGAIAWTVVFGVLLALLAGLYAWALWDGFQAALDPSGDEAQQLEDSAGGITGDVLWAESAFNLVLLGLIPIAWVALTRVRPRLGTLRYLHLDRPEWRWEIAKGLGLGILLWLIVVVLSLIQAALEGELSGLFEEDNATAESPLIEAITRVLTWPLALFVAFVAGFAEEIFFRGVLQRWIGVWGQGAIFGITHAGYGTWEQIVYPFALGIAFGYMVKRGWGLPLVIAAHFMFDFVQFALIILIR